MRRKSDSEALAALAAKYHALLSEALGLAQRRAADRPQHVRDILATGKVEALDTRPDGRNVASVIYRAEKYKRTWLSIIDWKYLEGSNAEDWADSMIETVADNAQMTETDSWPKPPARRAKKKKAW